MLTKLKTEVASLPKNLLIVLILYTACLYAILLLSHFTFKTYAWDTGLFNQVLWSTLQGKPFYYTLEPFWTRTKSFLGAHFAPLLILILPFYAIYPSPETLFLIHSIVITLGAIAIFRLSKLILDDEELSFTFSIAYLINPLVIGIALASFHLEDFFLLFTILSIYFFIKNDWKKYFTCIVLSLLTIEYAAIPIIAFGFTMFLMKVRDGQCIDKTAIIMSSVTVGMGLMYFPLAQYTRHLLGYNPQPLFQEWQMLGANYIEEVPFKVIENPMNSWKALTHDFIDKLLYLLAVFAPLLFLPILAPLSLLPTLPWFIISLFSNYPPYYTIWTQYPAYIIPFLFLAAALGAKKCTKKFLNSNFLKKLMLVSITSFFSLILILNFHTLFHFTNMDEWGHVQTVHRILALIPEDASVLTQNNIFPHVSNRLNAYTIPSPTWGRHFERIAKELLLNLTRLDIEFVLLDLKADVDSVAAAKTILKDFVFRNCNYGLYAASDGVLLFKRGYTGRPIFVQLIFVYNFNNIVLHSGHIVKAHNSTSPFVLYHDVNDEANTTFWFGPYTPLIPGKYKVTFRLMIDRPTTGYVMKIDVSAYDLGGRELASRVLHGSDFLNIGEWNDFTLEFTLEEPSMMVEFRGLQVSNLTGVYLDFIKVEAIELYAGC
jgi:uncharacterized membrane protein